MFPSCYIPIQIPPPTIVGDPFLDISNISTLEDSIELLGLAWQPAGMGGGMMGIVTA